MSEEAVRRTMRFASIVAGVTLTACAAPNNGPTPAGAIDGVQAYSITGTMASGQDPNVVAMKQMMAECPHGSPVLRGASGQDLAQYGKAGGVWAAVFTCSKLGN
jgi:hypothetical protein